MIRPAILALVGACLLFPATRAFAQGASCPVIHFGTFEKNAGANDCLRLAEAVMKKKGYELLETGGAVRIGGNNQVIVEVVCVPAGNSHTTAITVSAFSSDSRVAELARNEVRTSIVNANAPRPKVNVPPPPPSRPSKSQPID